MEEWFIGLPYFEKAYWIITIIATIFFLFVLVSTFLGADTDELDDIDTEIDADVGIEFQFFTFKNLVAFFAIFGWSGIACLDVGVSKIGAIIVSLICGLVMMGIMSALFYYIHKLKSDGSLVMKNAIGMIGEVYLTVGAKRASIGKVQIKVQGALRELEALTDCDEDLKQGRVIKVIKITANGILIIEPQN